MHLPSMASSACVTPPGSVSNRSIPPGLDTARELTYGSMRISWLMREPER